MKLLALLAALSLATLAAACGDDAPAADAPTDLPALSRLALDVPADLAPGSPLPIAWTVENAVEGQRVVLRLFAPGIPTARTSAGYVFTGSAPATVYAGTIAADGTLGEEEVAVAEPAASGQLSLALPSEQDGDWTVVAWLMDGDQVVDLASATIWRAAEGVRLDLSRVWARSDDIVRVAVRAKGAEPMRLSAWLTLPDGSITSLPGVVDSYAPVVEGDLPADLPPLLFEQLGVRGTGRYLVSARLETLDGQVRGSAGAMIQVCDEPGTITGTASAEAAGAPLAAFGLADRRSATTEIAADGRFSLAVPPGTWILTGASTAAHVEVGCGQTVEVALATAAARPRLRTRGQAAAEGTPIAHHANTEPNVRFIVWPTTSGDESITVAEYSASRIMQGRPGFSALTKHNIDQALGFARAQMQVGTSENLVNTEMLTAADFLVSVNLIKDSTGYRLILTLIDVHKGERVNGLEIKATTASTMLDLIDANIAAFLGDLAALRRRVDVTSDPLVKATWSVVSAAPGDSVRAQVTVSDPGTGRSIASVPVTATIHVPGGAPISATGTTDDSGTFATEVVIPSTATAGQNLKISAFITRRSGAKVTSAPDILIVQPANAAIRMGKQVLRTGGDTTEVMSTVVPLANGNAVGVATNVASSSLMGEFPVRFDTVGATRFEVKSLATPGPSKVTIQSPSSFLPGPVPAIEVVTHGYVVEPLDLSAFVEPSSTTINDHILEVRGVATFSGTPVPNLPVSVELDGAGTVDHGGFTDSAGRLRVYWRAPAQGEGTSNIKISIVKDAHVAERTLTVGYAPPCANCPLFVTPTASPSVGVAKSEQLLFTANQDVTWSVTDGTITEGLFTASDRGGVVHLVATSVQDPQKTVTVPIVVDCSEAELHGVFSGTLSTISGTPAPPFGGCQGGSPAITILHWGIDGKELVAKVATCPSGFNMDLPMNFSGLGCVAVYQDIQPGVCVGSLLYVAITPDLTTPGNTKRHIDVFEREIDRDLPLGSVCRDVWHAQGVYSR